MKKVTNVLRPCTVEFEGGKPRGFGQVGEHVIVAGVVVHGRYRCGESLVFFDARRGHLKMSWKWGIGCFQSILREL
jgi:hypothetical protein